MYPRYIATLCHSSSIPFSEAPLPNKPLTLLVRFCFCFFALCCTFPRSTIWSLGWPWIGFLIFLSQISLPYLWFGDIPSTGQVFSQLILVKCWGSALVSTALLILALFLNLKSFSPASLAPPLFMTQRGQGGGNTWLIETPLIPHSDLSCYS